MDPHDVFAIMVPDNRRKTDISEGATANPLHDGSDDDDDDLRAVEIEDVLYHDDILYMNGAQVTEARTSALKRTAPLRTQEPVVDEAGNAMTEPARDGDGKPIIGTHNKQCNSMFVSWVASCALFRFWWQVRMATLYSTRSLHHVTGASTGIGGYSSGHLGGCR